jgi:predicted Zn-dependent protease
VQSAYCVQGYNRITNPLGVEKRSLAMKFRLSLLTAVLFIFSALPCLTFGQTGTSGSQPTAGSVPGTPAPGGDPGVAGTAPPAGTGTQSTPVQPADPDKVKHDGGKDDVDAIGNRKIGQRGLGNWYSIESDIKMGKQYSMMVDSSSKMVTDPVITEYVNRLGQNLVRNSDAQVPFVFKIIDSDVVNAMSLPGGFVYVDSATILAADGEAELAGVMAHEIAHVAARHATRQLTRSQYANIGTIPLIFMGGGIGYAVRSAVGIGLPVTFMSFQRGFEAEADYLGLQYMYKAGYDPQSFVAFFEKLQAMEKKKPGTLARTFASHPQTPDRIAQSQEEIEKILPARPEYTVTTSEFDDVKSRLASLENRRKVVDNKDTSKPSLRRTSSTNSTGNDGTTTSGDDDKPTLKRRDDSN